MIDIEIKGNNQKFKYRVNGIVIKDNKLLTLRMKNNISYCLPGGHIEFGEDSKSAVIREMLEELNTAVKIQKTFAIIESFYSDKNDLKTHEISFYYIVIPEHFNNIPQVNYSTTELDKGELKEHHFEWLDLNKLAQYDFRPKFIGEKLINKDYNFEHIILK